MSQSAQLFCNHCGAANRSQAAFCAVCGHSLRSTLLNNAPFTSANSLVSNTLTGLLSQQHMLKHRYIILRQIGRGGFGAVYKAADTQFGNRTVAVKEMSQSSLKPEDVVRASEDFKREAQLLAGLIHPNLPRIYEQFTDTGRSYLVMDFIDGNTLEDMLTRLNGRKLPVEKVLDIGIQLSAVLEYLHTRQPPIIFRDLKPANVMLTPYGHVYLIDFGIARHFKPGKSKDTSALGSTGYAAPEQYGKSQTTPQTDIYGLGATLHQLCTGDDPSDTPFQFAPLQLPQQPALAGLDALVMSMVAVEVHKRPASATLVRQRLQQFATNLRMHQTNPLLYGIPNAYQAAPPLASNLPNLPAKSARPPKSAKPAQPQIRPQVNTIYICVGHSSRVTALGWSPNGKYLASGSYDKMVQLWDTSNGSNLLTYKGHTQRVQALMWSPDSSRVASAGDDALVHIWDSSGKLLLRYAGHKAEITSLAWSPDGKCIASASADTTVHVWDADTGTLQHSYQEHREKVNTVVWSPDGRRLASGDKEGKVHVRELSKEPPKRSFLTSFLSPKRGSFSMNTGSGAVNFLSWSPDSHYLAGATHFHRVLVWQTETGKAVFSYGAGSSGIMNAVAWSPNGIYLASASNDKRVEIYNCVSRRTVSTYYGHTGYVTAVVWSPNGTQLASAGVDHTVQVWRGV